MPGPGSSSCASPTRSAARSPRGWARRSSSIRGSATSRTSSGSWAWSRASTSRWRCPATRPRSAAALDNMAHGGAIAILGIPTEEISLDVNEIVFKLLTIRGIYGREMYETWYKMTVMLQSGLDITPAITAPVRVPRPRGGVRRGPLRRLRQGHPGLGPEGRARGGHAMTGDTPRPARVPRRRARRAARAPPLPAAARDVLGAGADRVGRRPRVISLSSNDYLGLTHHPRMRRAAIEAVQ